MGLSSSGSHEGLIARPQSNCLGALPIHLVLEESGVGSLRVAWALCSLYLFFLLGCGVACGGGMTWESSLFIAFCFV